MDWKPYILFPNEAQEWQTAPLGLSSGCLQVGATGPSRAALRSQQGTGGRGRGRGARQQTAHTGTHTQATANLWTSIHAVIYSEVQDVLGLPSDQCNTLRIFN